MNMSCHGERSADLIFLLCWPLQLWVSIRETCGTLPTQCFDIEEKCCLAANHAGPFRFNLDSEFRTCSMHESNLRMQNSLSRILSAWLAMLQRANVKTGCMYVPSTIQK